MSKGIEIIVIAIFIISVIVGPFSISSIANNPLGAAETEGISLAEKYGLLEDYNKGYGYYSSDSNKYINNEDIDSGYLYYVQDSLNSGVYGDSNAGENFYQNDLSYYGSYNNVESGYMYYLEDNQTYPIKK